MTTPSAYRGGKSAQEVKARFHMDEIAKLSSNESPLPTSPAIMAALTEALPSLNRYPEWDDRALRTALAAHVGRGVAPEYFVTGNGGCDILFMISRTHLQAGDEAILCPPTFPLYEGSILRQGATPIKVPLLEHVRLDIEGILAAVTEHTRLLYLCSPNNPTGSIITQTELDQLMDQLPEQVTVVADEVYHHFNSSEQYANSFGYLHQGRKLIIVHSFSKVFGLAGLRLGYAIAQPELAAKLTTMKLPFHINQLTVTAGLAAMADRDYIEETISLTLAERQRVTQALQQMDGVTVWPTETNFVLLRTDRPGPAVAEGLEKRGVMVRELTNFYMPDFLRVTMGLPRENDQFLQALRWVMNE